MYCTHCGKEISDDSQFCGECGRSFGATEKQEPSAAEISVPSSSRRTLKQKEEKVKRPGRFRYILLVFLFAMLCDFIIINQFISFFDTYNDSEEQSSFSIKMEGVMSYNETLFKDNTEVTNFTLLDDGCAFDVNSYVNFSSIEDLSAEFFLESYIEGAFSEDYDYEIISSDDEYISFYLLKENEKIFYYDSRLIKDSLSARFLLFSCAAENEDEYAEDFRHRLSAIQIVN